MVRAIIKKILRKYQKAVFFAASPFISNTATLNQEQACELLNRCSLRPGGTATLVNNQLTEAPSYDIQIIIPAYNVEKYLADCMDSVLNQKTQYSYHVILIDDGSTDQTPAIADRYKDDSRVTVIHQENKGFSGARNTGLSKLNARYIMFVDSDDMLCENAIESLLSTAFDNDCDVVEGGAYLLCEDQTSIEFSYAQKQGLPSAHNKLHGQPWAKIYKAHLFEHLCYPEGFWYEDSILSFFIWPVAQRVFVIPEMVYYYRVNPTGISSNAYGKSKSIDTYWVTEQLTIEKSKTKLPFDDVAFKQFQTQIIINQHRASHMPLEIQESIFVLTRQLVLTYFPNDIIQNNKDILTKAILDNNFGVYKAYCRLN